MSFVFRKILEEENDKALDKRKTLARAMCIERNQVEECNKVLKRGGKNEKM